MRLLENIDIAIARVEGANQKVIKIYLNYDGLKMLRDKNIIPGDIYKGIPVKINMVGKGNRLVSEDGLSWRI